ncbi:hypothetical protein FGL86_11210 [Pistricoccus aurantiacus]|uniref:Uncharacterized protein n=1 Tax=Pistricoccus aurantiacus TaxID=1883414 RepID=A0A5B8SR01_9GAMM|nr:hypothetical protein [Pistricoccus aurantiacus]QEA39589.1 hypothetical protein FGL86_11210 [Pistricoccus aurantiacus]
MAMAKSAGNEFADHLEGSDNRVALSGGYLYIHRGKRLVHIASIPSPNLLAERLSDSVVENTDTFVDEAGNEYTIVIDSTMVGITWSLEEYPTDPDVIRELHYEVRLNDD